MPIPYKLFTRFYQRQLHGSSLSGDFLHYYDWTEEHLPGKEDQYLGAIKGYLLSQPYVALEQFYPICKGYPSDGWVSQPGADHIMSVCIKTQVLPPFWNPAAVTAFHLDFGAFQGAASPNVWDPDKVTGRHYDGVNVWPQFPHTQYVFDAFNFSKYSLSVANLPLNLDLWLEAFNSTLAVQSTMELSDYIFRNGIRTRIDLYTPSDGSWDTSEGVKFQFFTQVVKMKFFNAVVNSLSRYNFPTTGGMECKIYGLGFQNLNSEINEGSYDLTKTWNAYQGNEVVYIYIEDRAGNVVATLEGVYDLLDPDFSVDSNSQITIPAAKWPALPEGIYYLRLNKRYYDLPQHLDIDSYAGDFHCDADGRVHAGKRIEIYVGDMTPRRRIFFFSGLGGHYAPIDVRAPETFYEGRILGISSTSRAIDDDGLCQFGDMNLTLANHDNHFSKLLAANRYKNTLVEVAWGYASEPASWARRIGTFIVSDHDHPGEVFNVSLRDVRSLLI